MTSIDNSRSIYGKRGSRPYDECPVPVSPEILGLTLSELADGQGLDVISRALRTYGVSVSIENYDNWNGGIWTWLIVVSLPPREWATLDSKGERITVEGKLAELANAAIAVSDAHTFTVRLVSMLVSSSASVTNQGRAHSPYPATIEHGGLLFRSQAEVLMFDALRDTGLPVMPLPVVASNRPDFKRIEPDFIVICRGMTFVVEVDGAHWHQESPAAAQERLRHLEDQGVRIIRVNAKDCNTSDSAKKAAKEILSRIELLLQSR